MKKYILIIVTTFVLSGYVHGQTEPARIITPGAVELNQARSLWANTSNAAGLAFHPLQNYNIASVFYHNRWGEYRLYHEGEKFRDLGFNTNGALKIGKVTLWGNFSFSDNFTSASNFNTNRNEYRNDMPYWMADSLVSDFRRQYYDVAFKVAVPLGERLSIGTEIDYKVHKGAKQRDPSSVIYDLHVTLMPSLMFKINDNHYAGANFIYSTMTDRTTFRTNSSSQMNHNGFLMRGVGNFQIGMLGGTGGFAALYTMWDLFGGGLQYGLFGNNMDIALNLNYIRKKSETFENNTTPQRRGDTYNTTYNGSLQFLYKGSVTHKVDVLANISATKGVEHLQIFRDDYVVKKWETLVQFTKSTFDQTDFALQYNAFIGSDFDYSWKIGIDGYYSDRLEKYIIPYSELMVRDFYAGLHAAKSVAFSASSQLLLELSGGYKNNMDGHYNYGGPDASHPVISNMYKHEVAYLLDSFTQIGCNVNYSFIFKSRSSANISLDWKWIKPKTLETDRQFFTATFAYIF